MSIPKYGKRDLSEGPIKEALKAVGASVTSLSLSDGPDLLVGWRGVTFLMESKTGKRKLREGQKHWHENWQGSAVIVVRTVDDALKAIGAI